MELETQEWTPSFPLNKLPYRYQPQTATRFQSCTTSWCPLPLSSPRLSTLFCKTHIRLDTCDNTSILWTDISNKKIDFLNIRSILIPRDCDHLPDRIFAGSINVLRVTFIHDTRLKRIGKEAFAGCVHLEEIEIPANVEEIGDDCFSPYSNRTRDTDRYGSTEMYATNRLSRVAFARCSRLKRIGNRAFANCIFQHIEIPASVEEIGENCFSNSPNLMYVTFDEGSCLKYIRRQAFSDCPCLNEIEIPASAKEIGWYCFSGESITHVAFCNGLKTIGPHIFRSCTTLQEIEIPASVQELGMNCFTNSSITRVIFAGDGVKILPHGIFSSCYALEEIDIPVSIEEIGSYSFASCRRLSRVTFLGNCLTTIGDHAFYECDSLTHIEIPSCVTHIGENCFDRSNLMCVTFAPGSCLRVIEPSVFARCYSLREIKIPAAVEKICCTAFYLSGLSQVTFPDDSCLKEINRCAFNECLYLSEIKIPVSIETIHRDSFYGCSSLETMILPLNNFFRVTENYRFRVSSDSALQEETGSRSDNEIRLISRPIRYW